MDWFERLTGFREKSYDNAVERPTHIPTSGDDVVLSGPILQIGTPWSKQARTTCRQKSDYDVVDLTEINDEFLPRTVYRPGNGTGDLAAFRDAIDEWPKPCLPGFWAIPDDERDIWEALCGEELIFYSIDMSQPGALSLMGIPFLK